MCRLLLSELPLAIVLEEDITSPQSPMDKLSLRFLVLLPPPSHSSPKRSDPSFQKMLNLPYPWLSPRNSAKMCLESSRMWTQLLPKTCSKSPPFDQPSFHLKNISNLSPQNELDFSFQNIAPYFQNKKTKNKKSCEYLPSIWMGYSKSHAKQTKKEWGLESIKITKLKIKNIKIMRLKKLKVNHMQFWEEWNIISFNLKRLKIINHKQFPKINK